MGVGGKALAMTISETGRLSSVSTRLAFLAALAITIAGCAARGSTPTDQYDAAVATSWFDLYLDIVPTTPGFTPPVASRAFGYAGVAVYESVVPGMPGYQSLAGQLNELTSLPQPAANQEYHWPTVANSALASLTRELFANTTPENLAAVDALEEKVAGEYKSKLDPAVFDRSVEHGRAVAEAIAKWAMTDGGHEGYLRNFPTDYTPPAGPGKWAPTPPNFQPALQPSWGNNRPFALKSGGQCAPEAPLQYSEDPGSEFYRQALEVHDTVANLTPEQKTIALYWADDPGKTPTPPGHSVSIATQVLRQKGASLALAAEVYAKVGIAAADSFIGCWNVKYTYNLLRPITYIQAAIDPKWNTPEITDPVLTPPFPEYTSGHSVQSGAVAFVLTDLFGESFAFTDHTHDRRGLQPRSFNSFFDFANEAAISRLYGGIHFRAAIERGLDQGKCIGQAVSAIRFRKQ